MMLDRVRFACRCVVKRDWPGFRLVEKRLDLRFDSSGISGGQPSTMQPIARPMALAESGDTEQMAEGVVGHRGRLPFYLRIHAGEAGPRSRRRLAAVAQGAVRGTLPIGGQAPPIVTL